MYPFGNNSPGKTSQEKLKNAFKEQFRTEISDYISDLDLNIQVSGRSSRSSNYSNKKVPMRVELSESLLKHFDTASFENNFEKSTKNGTEKINSNLYYEDNNSDTIVPLDDFDLITNNISIIPIFDDSSDSQASRAYQNQSATKAKKSNKNTKKIINRSKSPNTKNKFSLKVPNSKQIQRSKSPAVLSKKKIQQINRRKEAYTTGFTRPNTTLGFEPTKQKIDHKIERRGITQNLKYVNRTIPNNQKVEETVKSSPKHKTKIPEIRSSSPKNAYSPSLNKPSINMDNVSTKLNDTSKDQLSTETNYKKNARNISPRKSRIPSPKRSPQKSYQLEQPAINSNNSKQNYSEPIRNFNENFQISPLGLTDKSDSSDPYMPIKNESDSDNDQPFYFSPKEANEILFNDDQDLNQHNESKNDDDIENLISFSPVQEANAINKETNPVSSIDISSIPKPDFVDDLIDFSVIPTNTNTEPINDFINITPTIPNKEKHILVIDNPIVNSITTSPPLIIDIPFIDEKEDNKNVDNHINYKPKTLEIEEWATSFSNDTSQTFDLNLPLENVNQNNSINIRQDNSDIDNNIQQNNDQINQIIVLNDRNQPNTTSTDELLLDAIDHNIQNSSHIDLISFLTNDDSTIENFSISKKENAEEISPDEFNNNNNSTLEIVQDLNTSSPFLQQNNTDLIDILTNDKANIENTKIEKKRELSLEIFENDMIDQLEKYQSQNNKLLIDISTDETLSDTQNESNQIKLAKQNELNEKVEESKKNKYFPSELIKDIVLSITNVEKDINNENLPIDEDFVFSFQERICSLFEVEVISSDNSSIDIFPFDLNKFIQKPNKDEKNTSTADEIKVNENAPKITPNTDQSRELGTKIKKQIPRKRTKSPFKSENSLKTKIPINQKPNYIELEQEKDNTTENGANNQLNKSEITKDIHLFNSDQKLKARKNFQTDSFNNEKEDANKSKLTKNNKSNIPKIPSLIRRSSPNNPKNENIYSSPSQNKRHGSALSNYKKIDQENTKSIENDNNIVQKWQVMKSRKLQSSYGPQKTSPMNSPNHNLEKAKSPNKRLFESSTFKREDKIQKTASSTQRAVRKKELTKSATLKTPDPKKKITEIPKPKSLILTPQSKDSSQISSPLPLQKKPNDSRKTSPQTISKSKQSNQVLAKTKIPINQKKSSEPEAPEDNSEEIIDLPNKKKIDQYEIGRQKRDSKKTSVFEPNHNEKLEKNNYDSNSNPINQKQLISPTINESPLKKSLYEKYIPNDNSNELHLQENILVNESENERNDDNNDLLESDKIQSEFVSNTCLIRANLVKTKQKFSLKKPKKKIEDQ